MALDLKNLHCFVAVAEHLNFSRAAEQLFISQPALSIRIKALEQELGTSLFYRTHQQVYLTDAGAVLLPEIRLILEQINALPDKAAAAAQSPCQSEPKLLIGLDPMEERTDLPFMVEGFANFRRNFPQVSMECSSVRLEESEEMLLSGACDLCVLVLRPLVTLNPLFASAPLLQEPLVLFAEDVGNATAEEILESRELLMLEHEETWNRMVLNYLTARHIKSKIKPVNGTPAMRMNLLNAKTAAFLPLAYAASINSGQMRVFDMQIPNSAVSLTAVWNKRNMNPAIQGLVNELTAAAEQNDEWIRRLKAYCGMQ